MPTILITGANRGIGLELAKHYAGEGWRVIDVSGRAVEENAAWLIEMIQNPPQQNAVCPDLDYLPVRKITS